MFHVDYFYMNYAVKVQLSVLELLFLPKYF